MIDSFQNLGLKKNVIQTLSALNFTTPTEVQKQIIPLILKKKNLAFTSQTGSGKTVGFTAPLLSRINKKLHIQILILVPTRELCIQVGNEIKRFANHLDFNVGMIYGGRDLIADKRTISRRLHVLVATPGRLIQHVNMKTIKLSGVHTIIFDESDQMFDNGFYDDCQYIKSRVSSTAQVILASATITPKVEIFLKKTIKDFTFIEVGNLIPPSIVQDALFCEISEKNDLLVKFFLGEEFSRAIVFVNTKVKLGSVYDSLLDKGITTSYLSGDLDQKEREKRLRDFKAKKFSVLVCTDVASRGLHIPDVDIVLNYDIPSRNEFYVHRIGRTGRNGKKGYALSFVCPEDEANFVLIQKEYKLHVGLVNSKFELIDF